jgi:hypothetical protein
MDRSAQHERGNWVVSDHLKAAELLGYEYSKDFAIPEDLVLAARRAAVIIRSTIVDAIGPQASGGGCRLFYSLMEWRKSHPKSASDLVGSGDLLVVVYDGGAAAQFFNPSYECWDLMRAMDRALEASGYYSEPCKHWFSAIRRSK